MASNSKSFFYLCSVSAIAALAGLLFGFDTGIISGALLFIEKDFVISTEMKEFIVSSVLLGAMGGSLVSGRLADWFGRRKVMLIISSIFIFGTALASFANEVNTLLLGRLFIGLAIGMGSYTAPLYIAEVAPAKLRGGLVTLNQLAITIGILCSYLISYVYSDYEASWRLMFAVGLIPACLLAAGMFFLPESPRWLIKQNQLQKAFTILRRLRGQADVNAEVKAIQETLMQESGSFRDIFMPWMLPVLMLGALLGLIQQVTGINTIIYYAPTIFQMAGFRETSSSILATVGLGVVNVLATIVAVFFLDRFGRRPLLLTGLAGMFFSLVVLSFSFSMPQFIDLQRWLVVISAFVYIICFAFSLGAILWLMVSEIFPLQVRATAMSIAVFSCWFWNFVVSSTFLTLLNYLGATQTFLIYALLCMVSFVFCYLKVPETSGVSLEEIEENIRNHVPLRDIGRAGNKKLAFLTKR